MKKHLIAAAVTAAFAVPAAAQVTVYGTMDLGYLSSEYRASTVTGTADSTAATATKTKAAGMNGDGALSTSVIGFRGSEDLGGGLKAEFLMEFDLVNAASQASGYSGGASQFAAQTSADMATNTTGNNAVLGAFGARQSFVGISGGFGTIRLGRQAELVHSVISGSSAAGGNNTAGHIHYSAGPLKAGDELTTRPHKVFINNAYTYISPTVNGVTGSLQMASNEYVVGDGTTTGHKAEALGYSLRYAAGPLAITAARNEYDYNADYDATTNDLEDEATAVGASYRVGGVTVFGLHTKAERVAATVTTIQRKATEFGVRMPMGAYSFHASMFSGKNSTVGGSAAGLIEHDVDGYQFGAQYALSKRTTAYAMMGQVKQKLNTISTTANTYASTDINNNKVTQTAIGIRHTF